MFTGVIRDKNGKGWPIRLMDAGGVKVMRWKKILKEANPYDPSWEPYLEERMTWKLGHTLAGRTRIGYLWREQGGRCVVCKQVLQVEEQPCTSTTGDGAASEDWIRSTTWSCCTRTVTGRSMRARETDRTKPRPARDVVEGLSRMMGNYQVRFLGGWGAAMPPGYPTGSQHDS